MERRRHPLLTPLLATLLLLAGTGVGVRAQDGAVQPAATATLDEDRLVILEVRLDGRILSPGVLGFQSPAGVLLPLGTLCDLLEFAVVVEPDAGAAHGWIGDESRGFELDASGERVVVAGETHALAAGSVVPGPDDVYVTAAAFAAWFPCRVDVRLHQLLVDIAATEILPVQKRLRRQEMREDRLAGRRRGELYDLEKAGYHGFTWPLVDLNLEYRGRRGAMEPRGSLQSAGDAAGLATRLYASHDGGERVLSVARLRAGRTSNDADLLGPLAATRFEFGDLYAPSDPLVLRGKLGRGLRLGNQPLRQPDRFDSTEIAGDGPPGWEVELYANGTLLAVGEVDEEGRYLFDAVPLRFGRNEFRSVIYGPQGQVREHVRSVTVGGEMIPRGGVRYRLFAVQDDRFLLVGDDRFAPSPDRGRWTAHMEAGYGVGRRLSLLGSVTRLPLDGVDRTYRSLTAQTVLAGLHVQGRWVDDLDGGWAGGLGAQGSLFGRSLIVRHDSFRDFLSDANDASQQRTRETRLRLGGQTRWRDRGLAYDLKLQTTAFTGRGIERQDQAALRGATSLGGNPVTARLDYRRSRSRTSVYDRVTTDEMVSGRLGPLLLRGSLRTRLLPDAGIEALAASAAWRPRPDVRVGGRILRNLAGAGRTTVGGSLSLLLDSFRLSFNAYETSGQAPYFGVALTTSLTRVPGTGRLHVQRQRMSPGYGATARVFLDRNANGLFDDQDDPLPGVRLGGSGGSAEVATDRRGRAFLGGLPAHRDRDVTLDVGSIGDPYMLPAVEGLRATGHPGGHVVLDFPITFAGDVEGTVYVATVAGRVPARGITLRLTDLAGNEIARTISEFDGYYLFQEVPPGWYEVRVAPASLERRKLRRTAPVAVSIRPEGGVSAGNDFVLRELDARASVR